jgi:PAS domain S-box-containing protein
VVTAILFAVLSGEPASQAAVVRVGSELEFPPYAFVDKDGQAAGFSVNLIRAVTEAMGLQIEVTSGTWDSVWNRLVAGQLDVLPVVAKLSDRAQLVDFSLSHTETYDAFFVRRGSPAFATIEAARGKEIVVMRSDAAHHALVDRHFQGRLILVDTIPAGLSLVASGQHDAFLCSKLIGTLSLQKLGDGRISAGPPIPDYKRTFCFAVKRGDSELLEKLNQGLLILKANGEYQRIYDRWLSTEDPWSKWKRYLAPVALVLVAVFLAGVVWLRTVRQLVQRTTRELAEKNAQLRQIQDGLETAVTERTANLHLTNTRLQTEITEHKRTEEALRKSERQFRSYVESSPIGVFVCDERGRYLQVNPAAAAITGYSVEELIQMSIPDITPLEFQEGAIRYFQSVLQTARASGESVFRHKDGHMGYWLVEAVRLSSTRFLGFASDITVRKRMEEALKRSQEAFQGYFEMGSLGMCVTSLEKGWLEVNGRLCQMLGYSKAELIGFSWAELTHPDDLGADLHLFGEVMAGKRDRYELDKRFIRKDGSVVHTTLSVACQRNADGTVNHFLASLLDITERKRAEAAAQKLSERLQIATRAGRVGIWDWNVVENIQFWDDTICEIYGIPHGSFTGGVTQWSDHLHPDDRSRVDNDLQAALRGEREYAPEFRVIWPDGSIHNVKANSHTFFDENGKPLRMVGSNIDITVRKQAEERMHKQATLLDSANDAIYVRALDHTITYWNGGAERLYGLSSQQVLGRKITEVGGKDHAAFDAAHAKLLAKGNWAGNLRQLNKDGKERIISCRWTLLRDEHGKPKEVLAINADVTEQKQLEAQFLQVQRMEGIGMLAGGIAHDLNNILTPIMMSVPLLRDAIHDDENRQLLDSVQSSAQRGADIIRQLLTFARGQPGVRAPVLVRQLLREMEKLIRETFPRNLHLAVTVPPELWLVVGDATQIHQALMNLCVNARDAMPAGGTLTLAAENVTLDAASAALMPDAKPGPHVRLRVSDTGTGIPPAQLERIFDPFFTTKEIGKGTGLGLPTVLGIVRGHGGSVRVDSRVGQGSTFELYLPASLGAKASDIPEREVRVPRGQGELILVVDDEAAVRDPAQYVLEKYGYRVLVAAEGAAAMVLFALHRTEIKAVLTDMMMPGMDGPKLVRALRQLDARLPILGMTGLIDPLPGKEQKNLELLDVLAKPFEARALLVALHRALTAENPATGPAS